MPKERPRRTPDAPLRSWLRRIWMKCNEKAYANKREGYCCEHCGAKNSRAKGKEVRVIIHHKKLINWDKIFRVLRRELLVSPDQLTALCDDCHKAEHIRMKEQECEQQAT